MANEIERRPPADQQGALEVRQQVNQIQYLMREVLKDGEHFGTIKGCGTKPTLLQSGAEKIAYMFHFVPKYKVERSDLGNGHREYEVTCELTQRDTGQLMGGGMGLCSTMESKYRYRWEGYGGNRHRVENPDIADVYNTVLKMAKKRAFVDAVKSTTAASDIFTQDIEDLPVMEYEEGRQYAPAQAIPVQATIESAQQPEPGRPTRLNALRSLMAQAKQLGILVRDKADPNAGLLGWVWATYGIAADELNALSDAQIGEVEAHVRKVMADKQELEAMEQARQDADGGQRGHEMAEEAAVLADYDIAF